MGILNGSKCLFTISDLSLDHIKEIAKRISGVNGRHDGHPRIFVDASWLERKKTNRCGEIIGVLKATGFDVTVVFDPKSRHHSKVASISRSGKREKARLDAYSARFEAKLVSNQLVNESCTNDERIELEKKLEGLHAKAKKNENASISALLSPTFVDDLTEQLSQLPENSYGCQVNCLTGRYQADSVISRYVQSGECDIVFSPDSDFSFLGGEKCLQICDFKLTKSNLSGFVVKSGSKKTIQLAVDSANVLQSVVKKLSFQEAECPILEGLDDPRLRCAVAVLLGSDTFLGGVSGVGPAKILQILDALRDETQTALSEITIFEKALAIRQGSANYDLGDLSIATDAMYYEPCETIEEEKNENDNHHKYIFQSPIHVLDSYLLDFNNNPTSVITSERTALCHGHSSMGSHTFLRCFGQTCSTCHKFVCIYCSGKLKGTLFECLMCMGG
jgi:hypothetical protein